MVRISVACCLVWLLLLCTGCTSVEQPPRPPERVISPQPSVAENKSANPPPSYTSRYAPGYEDKEPKAKVPADACHPKQRIIAVFRHDSNVCIINGREVIMEGKATLKKHYITIPFKYIAAALGVGNDYTFIPEKNAIILRYRGKDFRFAGQIGNDAVLYSSTPYVVYDMGYDVLWDHHWGRFEILDPLPLTADDLKIDELYLDMGLDRVFSLLGRLPKEPQYYNHVDYPDYTFLSGFSDEEPHTIMVRSDRFATYRGIRVGDSLSKVFELYGRGYTRGIGYAQPDVFIYRFPRELRKEGYLSFEVDESNRVKEIVLNGINLPHYQVTR